MEYVFKGLRDDFYDNGGRICVQETEDISDIFHTVGDKAKKCPYRQANSINLTDNDLDVHLFANCNHPERHKSLADFCQPMIDRINMESNGN